MKRLMVIGSALLLSACSIVGPGERGVRISLGSISEDVKEPGVYLWVPFVVGMAKIDVQIQKTEIESTAGSKDMQDVHTTIAVNWSLSPSNVVKTYKEIGNEYEVQTRILNPAVNEVMKAATSKRTAEEVLTKRMELKDDIDKGLKERLAQYGITLHDISIVNLGFSKDFAKAIEDKQIAEQEAKQAEYVALKATQEAKAEVERAKGQATAQNLLKSTLTKELLNMRAIEKWDGKFPQVLGGQGALPFININTKNE